MPRTPPSPPRPPGRPSGRPLGRPPGRPSDRPPGRSADRPSDRSTGRPADRPASKAGPAPERGSRPPRGEAPSGAERPSRFGPRPLVGKPHRNRQPEDARPAGAPPRPERSAPRPADAERPAREAPQRVFKGEAPRGAPDRPKGRDRRGLGDDRPPRQAEPAPAPRAPRPSQAAVARDAAPGGTIWLHGLHAVAAALGNPRRRPRRLFLTVEAEAALEESLPKPWRLVPERVEKNRFQTFLPEDSIHQGAALLTEPLQPIPLEDAIAQSTGPVLVLDQVTDPRNVGAILRSAAAFGAACVVMQDRHAPPETGALARAASGALELVPIAREVNLSRAIVALQKAGFWVLGLAGEGKRTLAEAVARDRRTVLVLGAEDAGLRRLQRETCDELVRLPMAPGVESLNVAAAAAVGLYEVARGVAPAEAPTETPPGAEPEEETEE